MHLYLIIITRFTHSQAGGQDFCAAVAYCLVGHVLVRCESFRARKSWEEGGMSDDILHIHTNTNKILHRRFSYEKYSFTQENNYAKVKVTENVTLKATNLSHFIVVSWALR